MSPYFPTTDREFWVFMGRLRQKDESLEERFLGERVLHSSCPFSTEKHFQAAAELHYELKQVSSGRPTWRTCSINSHKQKYWSRCACQPSGY